MGKFCDGGDSMWRQKVSIYMWCLVSLLQYFTALCLPLFDDFATQVALFRLCAVFGGIAVGFYIAPSNSLSMSCLANQDETAVAKTLRMPAGAIGLVIGSTCIGLPMSFFQNDDYSYEYGVLSTVVYGYVRTVRSRLRTYAYST